MTVSIGPSILDSSLHITDLKSRRRESVLHELSCRARDLGWVRDGAVLEDALVLRERLGPTSLGKAVAAPHVRSITATHVRLLIGRAKRGVEWESPDDLPVTLVLVFLSPSSLPVELHHEALARGLQRVRHQKDRARLMDSDAHGMPVGNDEGLRAGESEALLRLADIDALGAEIADGAAIARLRKLGFSVRDPGMLERKRAARLAEVDRRWLGPYERALKRHGSGLTAVRDRVCLGCSITLPTSAAPSAGHSLTICESCGRLLYWG